MAAEVPAGPAKPQGAEVSAGTLGVAGPWPADVAAAVVTFNGLSHDKLPRTLKGLLDAGAKPSDITVYDIASTDDTQNYLAANHPDVKVVTMPENVGPSPARNLAIEQCERPFLMLMDSDAQLLADTTPKLRAAMDAGENIGIAAPISLYGDHPDTIQYSGLRLHVCAEAVLPWQGRPAWERGASLRDVGCAPCPALLLRIEAVRQAGPFDVRYFVCKEDGDWTHRVRVAGWRIVEPGDAHLLHNCTARGQALFRRQLGNGWHLTLKNYQKRTLLLLWPLLLTHGLLQSLVLTKKGHIGAVFGAAYDQLKRLKDLPRDRREIARTRKVDDVHLLSSKPLLVREDLASSKLAKRLKYLYDLGVRVYWGIVRAMLLPFSHQRVKHEHDERPLRMLFHLFVGRAPRAAFVQQTVRVAATLAKQGADVALYVCSREFETKQQLLDYFGLEDSPLLHVVCQPMGLPDDASYKAVKRRGLRWHAGRMMKLLLTDESSRYDVFFARGKGFPGLHALLKRLLSYKVIFEFHEIAYLDHVAEEDLLKRQPKIDFERTAYRRADGVIAITSPLLEIAARKWGPRDHTTVIPSGGVAFDSEPRPADASVRRLFFVGNLYPFSGIDDLVLSLTHLPDDVTLTIVGGGGAGDADFDRVAALIAEHGLSHRVDMRGFVTPDKLRAVYAEADALCMPLRDTVRARYFLSPLKAFEYMHARRAIVTTDVPTVRELLTDGESAVLATPGDPASLAAAVRRLVDDPSLTHRIAEASYALGRQYTMENKCDRIIAFCNQIAKRKPAGASAPRALTVEPVAPAKPQAAPSNEAA